MAKLQSDLIRLQSAAKVLGETASRGISRVKKRVLSASHMPNEVSRCVLKIRLLENGVHLFSRQGCSDTPLQDHDKSPIRFR
jgi:hypothetical protein